MGSVLKTYVLEMEDGGTSTVVVQQCALLVNITKVCSFGMPGSPVNN